MKAFLCFASFCVLIVANLHAAGSLKVTLTPAQAVTAGAQWRVDNGPWTQSGATVNNLSPGSHYVDFKTVAGWTAPSPTTIAVANGKATTASAAYVQNSSLKITLTPSSAQWKVDAGAWMASGATVTNLSPGAHAVVYQSVSGYQSPAAETVALTAGQTLTLARNYTQLAQLTLTLTPTYAQWRVDGGIWRDSGTIAIDLVPGSHGVDYSGVAGFASPSSETFSLAAGQSLTQQRNYIKLAQITVSLDPATGSWRVDSGTWQPSGATAYNLSPGSHVLSFSELEGYDLLGDESISLSEGQTAQLNRSYVLTPPAFAVVKAFDDAGYNPFVTRGRDGIFYGVTSMGGGYNGGAVFKINPDGTGYEELRTFHETPSDAFNPTSIIEGSDGLLYGTANFGGGSSSTGVIFRLAKDGSNYTDLRPFTTSTEGLSPNTLMEGADGLLYGTALTGGVNNSGVIFKMSKDATAYSVIRHLSSPIEGRYAWTLVQGAGNVLYGTYGASGFQGAGGIYKINTDGSGFSTVKTFASLGSDGSNPRAPLYRASDGFFYGTASSGGNFNKGTVFRLNSDGTGFVRIRAFASDGTEGSGASSPLCEDESGVLYGTCSTGGLSQLGLGTLYKLNKDGSGFSVLKHFNADEDYRPVSCPLFAAQGSVFATSTRGAGGDCGALFKIQNDGSDYVILKQFGAPNGALALTPITEGSPGVLYGSTRLGGESNQGTLYRLNSDGTGFQVIYNFSTTTQGSTSQGVLIGSDGYLYSPASQLFRISPDGTGFAIIHSFGFPDGQFPVAIIEGSDGALYGTTREGGSGGYGTIFRVNRDGSNYSILHSFSESSPEGQWMYSGLTEGSDGLLYGSTYQGGSGGGGTLFRLNKTGTVFTVLKNLTSAVDGGNPTSSVTFGTDGVLYGVTSASGPNSLGTIYRMNADGTGFTVLHTFPGSPIEGPPLNTSGLVECDGALFGTTAEGGTFARGTIYVIQRDGTGYTTLVNLGAGTSEGSNPNAALFRASDGHLYGTCAYGKDGSTVYRFRVK